MKCLLKRVSVATAVAGVSLLLLGAMAYASGARINSTRSIPVGVYWLSSDPVVKGAYVIFCPPQVGSSMRPRQGATSAPASAPVSTAT
jgi:type IV secretory pathway protease TraF